MPRRATPTMQNSSGKSSTSARLYHHPVGQIARDTEDQKAQDCGAWWGWKSVTSGRWGAFCSTSGSLWLGTSLREIFFCERMFRRRRANSANRLRGRHDDIVRWCWLTGSCQTRDRPIDSRFEAILEFAIASRRHQGRGIPLYSGACGCRLQHPANYQLAFLVDCAGAGSISGSLRTTI
jgi:hypothetical protein